MSPLALEFEVHLEKVRADLAKLKEKRVAHLGIEPSPEERVLLNLTAMLELLDARVYALEPRDD